MSRRPPDIVSNSLRRSWQTESRSSSSNCWRGINFLCACMGVSRVAESECNLAAVKGLGETARCIAFDTTQAKVPAKQVRVEPSAGVLRGEAFHQSIDFAIDRGTGEGKVNIRVGKISFEL